MSAAELSGVPGAGKADSATSMVARVALIMSVFDEPGQRLRLDQVVARTGLPRSSIHRILKQLESTGLLQRRPDGYSVAVSPIQQGHAVDHAQLRGVASRTLERLHADTGLVVHLGVLVGGDVMYLDKIAGRSGVQVPTRVASHTPAHASALGKSMLAELPAEEVDAVLARRLAKRTPATIADLGTLHRELARIRSRYGLAYDAEELAIGLCSIAAPIPTPYGEVAGLSLTGAIPMSRLQRTAPFVLRAARGISQQLGRVDDAGGIRPKAAPDTEGMISRVLRTLESDAWV